MKNKDVIVLKKILDYCRQLKEACDTIQYDLPELRVEVDRILKENGVQQ